MNFSYPPSKRPIFAYKLHRRTLNGVWGWRKNFIVAPSVYTGAKKNDEKNSLGTLINKNHNREKNLNCFFNFLHIFFRIFSGNSIFQKNIKKLIFSGNSIFRRELFPFFFRRRAFILIWNTSMGTRGPSKWMWPSQYPLMNPTYIVQIQERRR